MSTTREQSPAQCRAAPVTDAAVREDFLRAVSHVGIGPERAAALVERWSGRPFGTCGRSELLPLLDELLSQVRGAMDTPGRPACDA